MILLIWFLLLLHTPIKEKKLTAAEVTEIVKKNEETLRETVVRAIKSIPDERKCACGAALEGAEV